MRKRINELKNSILLYVLPFIYGCQGGDGGGTTGTPLNSLFGENGSTGTGVSFFSSLTSFPTTEVPIAVVSNPEPTTMLLVGTGVLVMSYYRNNIQRTKGRRST